jgi:DNA-binding XRE family transcriptional regulator
VDLEGIEPSVAKVGNLAPGPLQAHTAQEPREVDRQIFVSGLLHTFSIQVSFLFSTDNFSLRFVFRLDTPLYLGSDGVNIRLGTPADKESRVDQKLETFGRRVAELRLELLAQNQNEFAKEVGVAPSTLSLIENGKVKPRSSTVKKIAEALEVQPRDLWREPEAALPKAPAP